MTATSDQAAAVVPDGAVPVLSAVNVVKEFKVAGGHITAVDNVSVDFHAGKVLAVVANADTGADTFIKAAGWTCRIQDK